MASTSSVSDPKQENLRKSRLFKYQQTHKSEFLTSPSPSQCKFNRVDSSKKYRKTKVASAHDNNRNLYDFGFTRTLDIVPNSARNVPAVHDNLLQTSIIHDQTEKLNAEIAEQIMNIAKIKETFNNEIKEILNLTESKGNMVAAVIKLCALVQSNNDRIYSLHETTQQNFLKLLAIQKDLELSNTRRDDSIKSNNDKIQTVETKMACSSDLHKMWITFTCDKELCELKKSNNLINDAKDIFRRMDIDVDKFGIIPIRSAYFQHIKVGISLVPTLCVTFTNDRIASVVRRRMMQFNANLEDENRLENLRYSERIFWSKDVWKLLRICWELKRLKLVNFVFVNADGIRVQYNTSLIDSNSLVRTASMNVTCFNDIDRLRKIVGDIYSDVNCTILYDNNYFKLKFPDRDAKRMNNCTVESDDDNTT